MRVLIRGARCWSEGRTWDGDVRIRGRRITEHGRGLVPGRSERVVAAAGHVVLPGLINGHDHLALDLFPRLGSPPYANFYEWGRAIYHPDRSPLREILRIPLRDRLWWGGYRNLLGGATTVAHHDAYDGAVFGWRFPVRVVRRYGWAHSLGHAADIAGAFARARGRPFMIHALEGIDRHAASELDRLDELGVLGPTTVAVHAIALAGTRLERFVASGAAAAWCPASNRYLYGATAPVAALLRRGVRICLGTDSTLSGSATLLDEARAAVSTVGIEPADVLEMLTLGGAAVFGLDDGRGTLRAGAPADLVLVPDRGVTPADAMLAAEPADLALVLVGGRPRLARPDFARTLRVGPANVRLGDTPRWLYGRPDRLRSRIAAVAGPRILRENPVWRLLGDERRPGPAAPAAVAAGVVEVGR